MQTQDDAHNVKFLGASIASNSGIESVWEVDGVRKEFIHNGGVADQLTPPHRLLRELVKEFIRPDASAVVSAIGCSADDVDAAISRWLDYGG